MIRIWRLPKLPPKPPLGGAVTTVWIECRGDIGSKLHFFYSAAAHAVVKFGIKYRWPQKGQWLEKWYSFIAFDELAEYIASHFQKGSCIHILKAEPRRDRFFTHEGKKVWITRWIIREITDPDDEREALATEPPAEAVLHEWIPEEYETNGEEEGR